MFKIAAEPTFTHAVKASVPIDGGYRDESFKATFRVIDPAEAERYDLASIDGELGSTAFLKRVVVTLDEIGDAEGKPVPFSDDVLASVLKLPWARAALARGYFGAVSGARAGN